jgi:Flavodoxins
MKDVLLLYTEPGGNLGQVAALVSLEFDLHEITVKTLSEFVPEDFEGIKLCILGTSDYGNEDERWNLFFKSIKNLKLKGCKFAFFALGNQIWYPNRFVDVLGYFKRKVEAMGCKVIGDWPTAGYHFNKSEGSNGDMFYGLALDQGTQSDRTSKRIKEWTAAIKSKIYVPA